jgi:hypothetical protein
MPRLRKEEVVTVRVLAEKGQNHCEIARTVGVTEGTVRYHLRRAAEGAEDGRKDKPFKAEGVAAVIAAWHEERGDRRGRLRPVNVRELYEHLVAEHGYEGSYDSVLRYVRWEVPEAEDPHLPAGGDPAGGAVPERLGGVPGGGDRGRRGGPVGLRDDAVALEEAGGGLEPGQGPAVVARVPQRGVSPPGRGGGGQPDRQRPHGAAVGRRRPGSASPRLSGLRPGGGLPHRRLRVGAQGGQGQGGGEGAAVAPAPRPVPPALGGDRGAPGVERWAGRALGRTGDLPGDGQERGGELGGRARPAGAAADPARALRRGGHPAGAQGLHGALRGPLLPCALRLGGPARRGARLRPHGPDPGRGPGGARVPGPASSSAS